MGQGCVTANFYNDIFKEIRYDIWLKILYRYFETKHYEIFTLRVTNKQN